MAPKVKIKLSKLAKKPSSKVKPKAKTKGAPLFLQTCSNDTILSAFMKDCCLKLKATYPDEYMQFVANLASHRRLATGCTGSAMAEVVHQEFHRIYHEKAEFDFRCEKIGFKRNFARLVLAPDTNHCDYETMEELGTGFSKCDTHEKLCQVPQNSDIFVCGFSCKDLSKLFQSNGLKESLLTMQGSTGTTFRAMMQYVKLRRPKACILENVDSLDDDDGESSKQISNIDILYSAFAEQHYALSLRSYNTSDYRLPQRRKRLFIVCVHGPANNLSMEAARRICVDTLKRAVSLDHVCLPLDDFCLPNDHKLVQAELERSVAARTGNRDDTNWSVLHNKMWAEAGFSWNQRCPTRELLLNPWFRTLPDREKEVLVFKKATVSDLTTVDISQRIDRAGCGVQGKTQTLTPRMSTWLAGGWSKRKKNPPGERQLLGFEAMQLQGFPQDRLLKVIDRITDPQLKDLAGNAFSGTIFAALYIGLMGHLPAAPTRSVKRTSSDTSMLLDLMQPE